MTEPNPSRLGVSLDRRITHVRPTIAPSKGKACRSISGRYGARREALGRPTLEYLEERARRGRREMFESVLGKGPNRGPDPEEA